MATDRKTKAAQTRSDILDAAEIEMQISGVSGASFKRIAKRANVTRGAIYWHFEDKDALLTAIVERTHLPLRELVIDVQKNAPEKQPPAILRTLLVHGLTRLATDERHRRVCHIISNCREDTHDNHPVAELLQQSIKESLAVVEELCKQADEQNLLQADLTPCQASESILALMLGIYNCSLRYHQLFPIDRDWAVAVDVLLRGVFKN